MDITADLPAAPASVRAPIAVVPFSFDRGVWTVSTHAALRYLWDKGLSTKAIGDALGLGKNAIVGKAHRIHLPARASPIIRDGRERPARPPAAPRVTLPALKSGLIVVPVPQVRAAPVPRAAPTTATLSAKCQFPLWRDTERPTHRFCDTAIPYGESWCEKCRKRVYAHG